MTVTPTPVVATATPTPTSTATPLPLNHFQCYEAHHGPFPKTTLSLVDAFGPSTVTLKAPHRLCNPADKNGEDPTAPSDPDHLVGYPMQQIAPKFQPLREQFVTTQFATIVMDVKKPEYFLVPSSKTLVGVPPVLAPTIDHFKCYKVARTRFRTNFIEVDDQFTSLSVDIKKPARLCLAADKNGEGILDPFAQLLCYKIIPTPGTPGFKGVTGDVFVHNQFGRDILEVFRPTELCVPATLHP